MGTGSYTRFFHRSARTSWGRAMVCRIASRNGRKSRSVDRSRRANSVSESVRVRWPS
jgi:hypothetical protein